MLNKKRWLVECRESKMLGKKKENKMDVRGSDDGS
jgi:hypothetical protein